MMVNGKIYGEELRSAKVSNLVSQVASIPAARNFNAPMAGAATICVAEVEELVPVGELDPNTIHVPGIFIQRIFQGEHYEKRIEQRTLNQRL